MLLTPSDVRSRIAAAITAAIGSASGLDPYWRESPSGWDRMERDARTRLHLGFAVRVLGTEPVASEGRQRREPDGGVYSVSDVSVRFAHVRRGDDVHDDTDAAYDAHDRLRKAVVGSPGVPGLKVVWVSDDRPPATGDGAWFVWESRFRVFHHHPL